MKHAAVWEHRWFGVVVAGHRSRDGWPEADVQDDNGFRLDDTDTVVSVIADYRAQIAASEAILASVDLDAPCAVEWLAPNARWVAVHLIEETARHAGHADIIRETIDRAPSACANRSGSVTDRVVRRIVGRMTRRRVARWSTPRWS